MNRYAVVLVCLALVLLTLAVYWQVSSHKFINYDDPDYIVNNEHIKAGLTHESIIWSFTTKTASNWHPVTWLSHMLDCQLFGTKAGWHHLTNLLLHIANILLLFIVLKKMTGALWQSAFVAALFALHPLHVESVAWVAERKDVLSTLFLLLTMLAYTGYVKKPNAGRYLLTLLLFAFGLMAKPMLVTLPFVLLLLDYWPLQRFGDKRSKHKTVNRLVLEKIPFLILSVASSFATYAVQQAGGAISNVDRLPLYIRIVNAIVSYIKYISKMVWPTNLAVIYPYPVNAGTREFLLEAAVVFAVLAAITVLLIFICRKYKYAAVGWLWYLGTLVPVIGLVQVGEQSMADRYTYIPLTGLFIIAAWGIPELLRKLRRKKLIIGIAAIAVLVVLAGRTYVELKYWSNSTTLFEHAIEVTEKNYVAHGLLADALYEQGKRREAVMHYIESLRIMPNYVYAHNRLGNILAEQGELNEAIKHFNEALKEQPELAGVRKNMGKTLLSLGRLEESAMQYREVLRRYPLDTEAHEGLGAVLSKQGRYDESIVHFREAIRINPDLMRARLEIGLVLSRQGKLDQAVKEYEKILIMYPENAIVHSDYAVLMARQGKFTEAIKHFNEAIRIKPDYAGAKNNLRITLDMQKKAGKSAQPEVNSPIPPKTN